MVLDQRRVAVDASLAINFVIPAQPYHQQTVALIRAWEALPVTLVAPPLFESEADSVIRRYVRRQMLDAGAGMAAQELLNALPVTIIQHTEVRARAREIAEASGQDRVYDATYAALAELLGCGFWTADQAFHRDVKDTLDFVRFVGDFAAQTS